MGFFDGAGEERDREGLAQDELDSLARIEAGSIPLTAERRLQALGGDGALFTSGLSVNEFALLDRLGPRPVAQVMGASIHQIGWQYLPVPDSWRASASGWQSGSASPMGAGWNDTLVTELDVITRAWDQARRRALDRITEEARLVGADAVLGVRLQIGEHDWASGTVDYLVSGTAVRFPGGEPAGWPLLTDVSVQDYWNLYQAGYDSLGLVATTSVVFVSTAGSARLQRAMTRTRNQEFPELSQAMFAARDTARARLLGQARDHHADGVVGMAFAQSMHEDSFRFEGFGSQPGTAPMVRTYASGGTDAERSGTVVTFHAAGTAVRLGDRVQRFPPETVARLGGLT
jgi:uncharacterized protein YbjQ (UPF0145 family)